MDKFAFMSSALLSNPSIIAGMASGMGEARWSIEPSNSMMPCTHKRGGCDRNRLKPNCSHSRPDSVSRNNNPAPVTP